MLRRLIRTLLEPARDPLRDSFGISLERVAALRQRLHAQIAELRARSGGLCDARFEEQIAELEAEHRKLIEVEKRASAELDSHRTRQDLLSARLTAAQAQEQIRELIGALDDAHARAMALAESVQYDV